MKAARAQLGKPAIFHQRFVPSTCWEAPNTQPACMEVGLGHEGTFDCSGLVIHALSKVLGKPSEEWATDVRHTRQMWDWSADQVYIPDLSPGNLLVMRRLWTIDGQDIWKPAHIGIVGSTEAGAPTLIEAQAGHGVAAVIETPLQELDWREMGRTLGTLTPNELVEAAGYCALAASSLVAA